MISPERESGPAGKASPERGSERRPDPRAASGEASPGSPPSASGPEAELRELTVEYFASLREARGTASERVSTAASTPRELWRELKKRHGFPHEPSGLLVAVNDVYTRWDGPLREGDRIVFIPPVAGG